MEKRGDINPSYTSDLVPGARREHPEQSQIDEQEVERLAKQGVSAEAVNLLLARRSAEKTSRRWEKSS
jgi:hypothetical protein